MHGVRLDYDVYYSEYHKRLSFYKDRLHLKCSVFEALVGLYDLNLGSIIDCVGIKVQSLLPVGWYW
jgi:hypothetical protein